MPRILLLLVLLATGLVLAAPVSAAGDPAAGKIKGFTCTGCHGITGYKNIYPTYNVPRIGGQNSAYTIAALKAYKDGTRKHGTMNLQAESLSDQDIEDIASWLAGIGGAQ